MKLFLVTFTVDSTRRAGIEAILKSAKTWWHYLDAVWIIGTDCSLAHWQSQLRGKMTSSDSLLIVDITNKERDGWLPQRAWTWLDSNELQCNNIGNEEPKEKKR